MENLILTIITLIFIVVFLILKRIEKHLRIHGQSLWLIMERLNKKTKCNCNCKKPKKNGKV